MNTKIKQLSLGVATVLAGLGAVTPSAQAVYVNPDHLGQVIIFPYYTVRDGWKTLFNVTNTSDQIVAIKVRFHEGKNSRDVHDINVILSPKDVWNGWLEDSDKGPVLKTNDKSCVAPSIGVNGNYFENPNANVVAGELRTQATIATGDTTSPLKIERLKEGYVNIIMMGSAPRGFSTVTDGAIHNNGKPANCGSLISAFNLTGFSLAQLKNLFPNYVADPLKGSFSIYNEAKGLNTGGDAIALANFYNPAGPNQGVTPIPGTPNNLVTAQLPIEDVEEREKLAKGDPIGYQYSFHEPELSRANTGSEFPGVAPLTFTNGTDQVANLFNTNNLINQWVNSPAATDADWSVKSDWVINFITKRFYVDNGTPIAYSGRAVTSTGAIARVGLPALNVNFVGLGGCDEINYVDIYGREEENAAANRPPVPSPAPVTPKPRLCQEVNVLTFRADDLAKSNVLSSKLNPTGANAAVTPAPTDSLGINVTDEYLGTTLKNGWIKLNFWNSAANAAKILPATGFAVISRTKKDGLSEIFTISHAAE